MFIRKNVWKQGDIMEKVQIRISVRSLVEFILRSGDIDNRHVQSPENAMLEGGRIHRMIQNSMGPYYHAEVSLRYQLETERYELSIEGRADGIEDLCACARLAARLTGYKIDIKPASYTGE